MKKSQPYEIIGHVQKFAAQIPLVQVKYSEVRAWDFRCRLSVIKNFKSQNTNHKQITMTEIQNPQQLAFDLICNLDIVIWNLFVIWCLLFVISGLSRLGDINHYFIKLGQGLRAFFSKKNANSNRNGIGVFFFAVNFLF